MTPLLYAADGHTQVAQLLLEHGANKEARDYVRTPMYHRRWRAASNRGAHGHAFVRSLDTRLLSVFACACAPRCHRFLATRSRACCAHTWL